MKEINEMCRFSPSETGLNDIYIWIGKQKTNHHHRVKISNKNNKFDVNDCFIITIPKFEIIGNVYLDKRKLDIIKDFLSKYPSEVLRLVFLSVSYGQPLDFTFEMTTENLKHGRNSIDEK